MKRSNQILTVLGSVGAGAALMYFLDPERGGKRRTEVRDKASTLTNGVKDTVNNYSHDLKEKASNMYNDARSYISQGAETVKETAENTADQASKVLNGKANGKSAIAGSPRA